MFKRDDRPTFRIPVRLAEHFVKECGQDAVAVMRQDATARPLQAIPVGVMGYSLFIPHGLKSNSGKKAT